MNDDRTYLVLFLDEKDRIEEREDSDYETSLNLFNNQVEAITGRSNLFFDDVGDFDACPAEMPGRYVDAVIKAFTEFNWQKPELAVLFVRRATDDAGKLYWKQKPAEPVDPISSITFKLTRFLGDQLRLWEDDGVVGPENELQSIQAWLQMLGRHGAEKTMEIMRTRMTILFAAATALGKAGKEAEDVVGIYSKRSREEVTEMGTLNREILDLHRALASARLGEKLHLERLEAKNRECAQLREQIAKLNEQLESHK